MIEGRNLIDGQWVMGNGEAFASRDPALGDTVWQGKAASRADVGRAVEAARRAFPAWSARALEERIGVLEAFAARIEAEKEALATLIARENGKPLWDARGEAAAVAGKIPLSIAAYRERTGRRESRTGEVAQRLVHRPHGVMAVYGPYNFPAHLPNGHIVPALLAGNCVILKPSELTPAVAQWMGEQWLAAGLPPGVLNIVAGGRETGIALAAAEGIDGILFTGSARTGIALHRQLAGRPEIVLALEMGGNNPLVVADTGDAEAAAALILQSAYLSSGQRCTCARRLILVGDGAAGIVDALVALIDRVRIGAWNDSPEPFMGPLVDDQAAGRALAMTAELLKRGGRSLRPLVRLERGDAFLTPALVDVTGVADLPDEEIFGPVLQLVRVPDFETAIAEGNRTRYGLSAGLISDDAGLWQRFSERARAGIVNWNRPLTGASSAAPFGGIGLSGNHRPSAYYAADYCAWPMASLSDAEGRARPGALPPGIEGKR